MTFLIDIHNKEELVSEFKELVVDIHYFFGCFFIQNYFLVVLSFIIIIILVVLSFKNLNFLFF
jgi:hypothetical protein